MLLHLPKKILLLCCSAWLIPLALFAGELSLGEGGVIAYDSVEVKNGVSQYFVTLDDGYTYHVADTRDLDADGDDDIWIVYKNAQPVLEGRDTTDDGVPDTFYVIETESAPAPVLVEKPVDTKHSATKSVVLVGVLSFVLILSIGYLVRRSS